MPALSLRTTRTWTLALLLAAGAAVQAQPVPAVKTAPGFAALAPTARVVVIPSDMELYSISAGGLVEPRADWTEQGLKNFGAALAADGKLRGTQQLTQAQMDEFTDVATLHRAVAGAIIMHHLGNLKLPTKNGELDWSLGEAVQPLRASTGADYALFTYVRDTYASTERKLTIVGMALLGAVMVPGEQEGYASLVDLHTGRVVWFASMNRMWGDLRDGGAAQETVDYLLKGFPERQ